MALNNDAKAARDGKIRGDPTEVALLEAARHAGFTCAELEQDGARIADIAFDARRRRMTTLHRGPEHGLAIVKGAPEGVLPLCRDQLGSGGLEPVDREAVLRLAQEAAEHGYRLLAFAERQLDVLPESPSAEDVERDLTYLGLVALADPPRPEVDEALAACASAGIRVAMITGDHPATAKAVAVRLGIAADDDAVITGADLQKLSEEERGEAAAVTRVYARVAPEQKYDIVTALQRRGQFVAMTGDGVNDAPALRQADIGVAMGLKGTDVASSPTACGSTWSGSGC